MIPDASTFKRLITLNVNTTQPMDKIIRKNLVSKKRDMSEFDVSDYKRSRRNQKISAEFRFTHHLYNFDDLLEVFNEQLKINPSFREA